MDYEKSDLDHAEIFIHCPACGAPSTAFVRELEKHAQVICLHCDCLHTVDVEERKTVMDDFWQMVKKAENGE